MKRPVLLLCTLLIVTSVAATAGAKAKKSRTVEEWAAIFDDPARHAWQLPATVIQSIPVQEGDRVADIGAGTGYFTALLSIQVGNSGQVFAVEIDQQLLDHIRARKDVVQERVTTVLAEKDDPKLPEAEVDIALIVNTWHHIKSRPKYLESLQPALSLGGRVVIIDFREGELPVGPGPDEKLARERVIKEFTKAGWTLAGENVALPFQYFLTFYPPARRATPSFLLERGD